MILLQGRTSGARTGVAGLLLVVVGLAILLSGIALLAAVAIAGAALGGAVMLFRRLTGRPVLGATTRAADPPLEVPADFEILPSMHDRPGEDRGDREG